LYKNILFILFVLSNLNCGSLERNLDENPSTIVATFSNYGLGVDNSCSYVLGLNLNTLKGTFTLNIPAQSFVGSTQYKINLELDQEIKNNLNTIISEIKIRRCKSEESIISDYYKSVSFSYEEETYSVDTDTTCVYYKDDYYFKSSYSELYFYFKFIISKQTEVGTLPSGWQDKI